MFPDSTPRAATEQAVTIHQPTPVIPVQPYAAPLIPVQPDATVASVVLPDGRVVTGYTLSPHSLAPTPEQARPAVSRTAVNIALGGVGFAAVCGGLVLLTTFIAALAALVHQLIVLAAVIFGGWIATQVLRSGKTDQGTTVNIRKAVFKRNHFHG
ncbi:MULTISPECIES: hypothetical protein [unclassified Streptomyces]|uniref:hypothetical protein n=1 Tax=unclassified Streptomyces TaxID=2593676 RepID=UPI00037A99C7|nr:MULTISPECIES: hypothetical protein [unclassified Streptomyces]MYX36041.1 hypothetical protein [Streptomyces sp. SID8377]